MTTRTPRPGSAVRGSTTGRPLMAAFDLLGRRWALRILWELREEPLGARALLARCEGLSPSVMYERLGELSEAALIARRGRDYTLTALGRSLSGALEPLDSWSRTWAQKLRRR